ncbi:MAG: xanthine dehydrogenase family protein molybdopterin-binding subunit [Thermomicrobiales bacterium]
MTASARSSIGKYTIVGHDAPRIDALAKVTGAAQFAGDLRVPGMAFGRVLRSPYAHARISSIDASRAEALSGVIAVMTGANLPTATPNYGHALKDRPVIATDRVRFVGEPVAAIAAEDPAIAAAALTLIDVEYEELPAAVTIDAALAADAPHLHDVVNLRAGLFHGLGEIKLEPGNICYHHAFARGDAANLFANADVVVEGEYLFPAVYQYALEPHTTIAQWTGDDDLTVWSSCQHPFLVRAELADLFGLPVGAVRVVVPYLGGGFGSKSYTKMEPITSALARVARRPVRIANSVDEAMVTTRRHGMKAWLRTAATSDGRLLGREVRAWFDTGAYADNGPRVVATGADAAPGPYRWEAVKVDAWGVYTNTSPAGSYRAFGASHLQWCGELQVDEIARRCGLDALQIRERNLLERGEYVRPGGKPLDADLVGDIRRVAASLDWDTPKPAGISGRGMSVGLLAAGAHPVSTAAARMEADGGVTLLVSSTEVGQGARTVFSQIVAEQLALPLDQVRVLGGDTRVTPYDRSTGASRSTTLAGLAVQRAADDLRQQLLSIASRVFMLPEAALSVRAGAIWHESEAVPYPDLIKAHFGMVGGELIGHGEVRPEHGSGSYAEGPVFWEVCIGGAEVTVDPDTGRVTIQKAVSVADVGTAINPRQVEAQEMGGALQGIGNALHEEMIFDATGTLQNATLYEYHVPTIADMPKSFTSNIVENQDGPGPYGAKGVGEGALAGVAAAIATALADAGVPVDELPATPERIWRALARSARESGGIAHDPASATGEQG